MEVAAAIIIQVKTKVEVAEVEANSISILNSDSLFGFYLMKKEEGEEVAGGEAPIHIRLLNSDLPWNYLNQMWEGVEEVEEYYEWHSWYAMNFS